MTAEEWLGITPTEDKPASIGLKVYNKKYRKFNESFEHFARRVADGDEEIYQLLIKRRFLPGGRIMSNIGVDDDKCSMMNCYSRGFILDDYNDIMQAAVDIGKTFKAQGGQGLSLSKLRPKGTPIGDKYESDGIIPFMKIYNEVTEGTSQGGARKGALLISLDAWHKEAMNFITIKSKDGLIEKANLSLEIDDEFMSAVKRYYETGEIVKVTKHENYSGHEVEWEVAPIEVLQALIHNNWDWGDPGCLFVDQFRNYNLMEYVDGYQIETCNPCGEQPLPKNFACKLGSLNLAEFVVDPYTYNAKFDYDALCSAVAPCVRYLDHIVDLNAPRHPLPEQRENSLNYRNIGLGVFGYGSALMKLGLRYGSSEALKFTDELFNILFRTAVLESSNLAESLGAFPKYSEKIWDSRIIQRHFSEQEIAFLKKQGLRNCSLLSIAPTGSLSTMLGETGGCEPEFAISYKRRTVGLTNNQDEYYDVFCKSAREYMEMNRTTELPEWFVSSADIDPHDRVATQAVMQLHVDTAISSTVNLPESCSEDEMASIYIDAWESGLKGITIFRNGCKLVGILTSSAPKNDMPQAESKELQRGDIISASDALIAFKKTITSGCGKFYLHSDFDEATGEQLETFIDIGSGGGCERNLQFIFRLISLCLRGGIPVEAIIDQGKSIRPCNAYVTRTHKHGDTSPGTSCPSAIAFALEEVNKLERDWSVDDEAETIVDQIIVPTTQGTEENAKCPECGAGLTFEGGCNVCKGDATHPGCGWSKCG